MGLKNSHPPEPTTRAPTALPPLRGRVRPVAVEQDGKRPVGRRIVRLRQVRLHPAAVLGAVVPVEVAPAGARAVGLRRAGVHARVHARDLDAAHVDGLVAREVDAAVLLEPLRIGVGRVQRVVGPRAGDVGLVRRRGGGGGG